MHRGKISSKWIDKKKNTFLNLKKMSEKSVIFYIIHGNKKEIGFSLENLSHFR